MMANPITTVLGIIIALCPIIGSFVPEVKAVCEAIMGQAIGLGFISAKDAIKLPIMTGASKTVWLLLGASIMVGSACAQLLPVKNTIDTAFTAVVSGTYDVTISKNGVVLFHEQWDCTSDGTKLTGCHKLLQSTPATKAPASLGPDPGAEVYPVTLSGGSSEAIGARGPGRAHQANVFL